MQIGLGWYGAALLHLVAHSLYKAHAFLGSGSAVADGTKRRLLPPEPSIPLRRWLLAGGVAIGSIALITRLAGVAMPSDPAWWAANLILAGALTPLVARALTVSGNGLGPQITVLALLVWLLNLAWHGAADAMVGSTSSRPWLAGFVLVAFTLLFLAQGILEARPAGRLARALYPRLFAGLHLDELFTRSTLLLWPVRLAPAVRTSADLSPSTEGLR